MQRFKTYFQRHPYLFLTALSIPLFFVGLGAWGFFDPDEGRYGEIPREMLARHDFITPTLNYINYFEKPPLFYWAVAGSYKLFGIHEGAARLVPALAALIGLFTVYALGRRMFGPRAALLGAVILATTLFWVFMARYVATDMMIAVIILLALTLWWMGHTEATEHGSRQRQYFLGFWGVLALGVLCKGPMAVILVGGTIFLYSALCRQWRAWAAMQWLVGVPLFLLITVPWFVLVAQRNPEFNHFFWYEQNLGRFLGTAKIEHRQRFYWFVELMPLLLFPWSFLLPGALVEGCRNLGRVSEEKRRALIFLMCGATFITGFFSASSSKLATYILPVLPLVALLSGAYVEWLGRQPLRIWRWPIRGGAAALASVLGLVSIVLMTVGGNKLSVRYGVPKADVLLLGAVCLFWAIWVGLMLVRRQFAGLIVAIAGGFGVCVICMVPFLTALSLNHSNKVMFGAIEPGLQAGAEFVMWDNYTQSASFYARRRVALIRPRAEEGVELGELGEIPLKQQALTADQKQQWFPVGRAVLQSFMAQSKPCYCLVRDHLTAQQLVGELGGGAREIIWNKRRSILGNRAAAMLTPPKVGGVLGITERKSHVGNQRADR